MNPEFERNVWLELTPRRVLMMAGLLALTFFAASLADGVEWGPSSVASFLYYAIVVVWGSRNAAMSVVGEIRDRTWDMQRLSSLSAATMTWGKLFGSTIYNWLGGAICLAVMMINLVTHQGPVTAAIEFVYYIGIGVIAQSASLLASLIAIGRRQAHSRLDQFVYQAIGLCAALAVYYIWNEADPVASVLNHKAAADFIPWWGISIDARGFLLVSLAIFAGWTLLGCYREMRLELKMRNGPLVWLAFLAFMGLYVAGFDAWLSPDMKAWDAVALRLLLAGTTYAVLTYVMVLLEPKDRVHYRWMAGQFGAGHIANALSGVQAWMMSYGATLAAGVLLSLWLMHDVSIAATGQPLVLATLGFITRDVSIFVLMQTLPGNRRGDLGALALLFALYVLAPAILAGLGAKGLLFLFFPQVQSPTWLGALAAWIQASAVVSAALTRLALVEREAAPA
ncbi:MAG: hypothetical protein ACXWLZ_07740 [Rhizomicrobium sp.]